MRVAGMLVSAFLVVGCGRDFDALFVDGPEGGEAPGDGGAEAEAGSCGQATDCRAKGGEVEDGRATYTCTGCACSCSPFECPSGGNVRSCVATCGAEAGCDVRCQDESCSLSCKGSSPCLLTCSDVSKTCNLDCESGAKKQCDDHVFSCNRRCP